MGFDANSRGQPLVNVHRQTTKVNFWVVGGVAFFLLVCVAAVGWMIKRHGHEPPPTPPEQKQQP